MNNDIRQICAITAVVLFTLPAYLSAESVSVDMALTTPSPNNILQMEVEAIVGTPSSDDDSSELSGNALADLQVNFDRFTCEVNDVTGLEFTGGAIGLAEVSFTIPFGVFGNIYVAGTGISGTLDTPNAPGAVSGSAFDASKHKLILNGGALYGEGTGIVGGLFDPFTIDLTEDPINSSNQGTGTILISLLSSDDLTATYQTTITMPVSFTKQIFANPSVTIDLSGGGTLQADGQFTRCTLWADLTDDCRVDWYDLAEFSDQWLAYDESLPCPLTADLTADDCYVDFFDFDILAYEWQP
ncbi:MAG: hypothetical protein JSW23_01435 [Planctomycetota bacterium]|nr:MAG: hypothetical protein JSW23_01435 [Planctomycetota bacterium]